MAKQNIGEWKKVERTLEFRQNGKYIQVKIGDKKFIMQEVKEFYGDEKVAEL